MTTLTDKEISKLLVGFSLKLAELSDDFTSLLDALIECPYSAMFIKSVYDMATTIYRDKSTEQLDNFKRLTLLITDEEYRDRMIKLHAELGGRLPP